ncbi:hypothetical protein [Nonomuraea sp. NPDC049400]|uniref:hypothetical protein n=1 Tax=Nonomuraea sp. NPDC049400 TaxID=3364352 RepID=UPI00378C32BC
MSIDESRQDMHPANLVAPFFVEANRIARTINQALEKFGVSLLELEFRRHESVEDLLLYRFLRSMDSQIEILGELSRMVGVPEERVASSLQSADTASGRSQFPQTSLEVVFRAQHEMTGLLRALQSSCEPKIRSWDADAQEMYWDCNVRWNRVAGRSAEVAEILGILTVDPMAKQA